MKYIPGCCLSCTKWLVETFWHFLNTSCPAEQISSWTCMEKEVNTNPASLSVRDFIGWMPWREAKVSPAFPLYSELLPPGCRLPRSRSTGEHTGTRDVWTRSVPALLCWFAAYLATAGAQRVHSNRYLPGHSKTQPLPAEIRSSWWRKEININNAKELVSKTPLIKCSVCRKFSHL